MNYSIILQHLKFLVVQTSTISLSDGLRNTLKFLTVVQQKGTLHDKGRMEGKAKVDFCDKGGHSQICMMSLKYSPLLVNTHLLDQKRGSWQP